MISKKNSTEVVLIVECEKYQSEHVEQILWRHRALGVTKHPKQKKLPDNVSFHHDCRYST